MSLKDTLQEDMKGALRAKDTARLGALRLLLAAIKQREIDERIQLDDAAVIAVVDKQIKQRRDAAAQYDAAQRADLANAERFEIEVLSRYMPAGLSDDEIAAAIDAAIAESSAAGIADMGKVMAILKPALAGRADMADVSRRVRAKLA